MKGNLILIHGGGPTAVINASMYGAITEAKKHPEVERVLAAMCRCLAWVQPGTWLAYLR